jgi:predicted metal-dependent enzyme (double-stranded beta helix superfamily)
MSFDLEAFIESCLSSLKSENPAKSISKLVTEVVSDPEALIAVIGKPVRAGITKLYVSETLTIANFVWAPKMTLLPHNHNMWAVIGVYEGREDNIFWRRIKDDNNGKIEAAGAKSLAAGDSTVLGKSIIHSVTNPTSIFTGAIHVYGGNLFENERSEWEPLDLEEKPYDIEKNLGLFEAENEILDLRKPD